MWSALFRIAGFGEVDTEVVRGTLDSGCEQCVERPGRDTWHCKNTRSTAGSRARLPKVGVITLHGFQNCAYRSRLHPRKMHGGC